MSEQYNILIGVEKMNSTKIGKNLVGLRGNRTQEEVARALNISVAAVGMYERGERIPRDEIKINLAKFYDTTVQAIFYADE